MTKKGQLTLFIIIGLLLLIGISIYVYLTTREVTAPVEAERIRIAEVPAEMQPLRDFIQDCLKITAKDGLMRLGQRGGYISPRHPYNAFEPTAARALQLAPDSSVIVPYWWHMNAKNTCKGDCTFATERPTLEEIKTQLDAHIARELPKCLGEFRQFKEQNFAITPAGRIKPETRIAEENVIVLLTYPIEVRRAGETFKLEAFVTELPVAFGRLYSLATKITALEAEYSFLEHAIRSLIDIFGKADENSLPPVSDFEVDFGIGTFWTKFSVLEKVKEMLASYTPMLKVTDTSNYRYLPAPAGKDTQLYEVLYNRGFTVPVLDRQNRGISAKFVYLPWWRPYMDLNCNGQLCQAEGINNALFFTFGIRRYNFAYDVSYPLIVELTDTKAFGGEGYTFRIALEANLRNNEPLATVELPPSLLQEERSSMLCDPDQRTSGNITVNVLTSAGNPVDEAEVLYTCGGETCHIGATTKGKLVAKFPRCIGGFVSASHPDYAPATKPLDITDAGEQTVDLIMPAAHNVDFSVKKWLLRKDLVRTSDDYGNWDVDASQVFNQGPREQTLIILERKGPEFEQPIVVLGEVCGAPVSKAQIPCGSPPTDTSKNISVYAGDYHVTIYSFNYPSPDLVIPADKRHYDRGPFKKRGSYTLPEIRFTQEHPMMSGSAEYDWSVTEDELRNAKNIEFTYINFALDRVPLPDRKIEDLEAMGKLPDYAMQYKDILMPRIT